MPAVVGMAKLGVDFDASCIITHAYQPCLLQDNDYVINFAFPCSICMV